MNEAWSIIWLLPFYLLGAFPSGILIGQLYKVDVTQHGSGNVGATNVARTAGKVAGLLTLASDIAKGALGVLLAKLLLPGTLVGYAGVACVAGHCFSIPGKLKGGKGVATALGVLTGFSGLLATTVIALFLIVFGACRRVSVASVTAALLAPIVVWTLGLQGSWTNAVPLIAILVTWRHKQNLQRLINGTEPRFVFGKREV